MKLFLTKHKIFVADSALVLGVFFWGFTFHTVKSGLNSMSAVTMVFYRFSLAVLILLVFLLIKKRKIFQNVLKGWLTGFFLAMIYIPQTIGLQYTSVTNSAFITGLFVAFVPLFYILFFKKFPHAIRLLAALLSLIGLWYLTGGFANLNYGDLITLINAVACALYMLLVDKFVKDQADPFVFCFHQFFFVALVSFVWILFFGQSFVIKDRAGYETIIFLAFFATLYCFVVLNVVQKFTSPMKTVLICSLEPVFAAITAWTIGGESFVWRQGFGGFLIILAMIISEIPLNKIKLFALKPNEEPDAI
jgi:drug/metabolite transporter (DMT)-like permease